ncbi:MAG: CoA pyrophosphatase [Actinobacteria bacterium]|nr:CoA pyrophosphatase [Actinomycetota bacterium]MCA1722139.1 CoA pyrophosphatase [Actinomycetota bacterium]
MTVPGWLRPLADALPHVRPEQISRFLPPASGGRRSAVLVLFGEGPKGPDLLFIERAATLRSHAGQPAFPGGAQDADDAGPVAAALREAQEEVGVDPAAVDVLGTLPDLWLPPSGFVVTPVVAWWRAPHEVGVVDTAEVAAVERIPLAELTDPANRLRVTHPSGWIGPAFDVGGLLIWGFTAGLTDRLLALGGWELPWDITRVRELDAATAALALRTASRPTP